MECPSQKHDPPEYNERIRSGKFVAIPDIVEIPTDNLCGGKVICDKQVKMSVVHNVLQHAWGRYFSVRVQEVIGEVIPFEFENEEDHKDAIDWYSWAIQGHCLSLIRWQKGMRISNIPFHMLQFSVQIHGSE